MLPRIIRFSATLGAIIAGSTAHAVDYYKANNTNLLDHIAAGNLIFSTEASSSLTGTWSVVQIYPTFGSAGTTVYTDNVAVGTTNRRFIRLAIAISN